MKNLILTCVLALAACAAAFGVVYALNDNAELRAAAREGDAMAWLRAEFRLNDAQFTAIEKLHEDYAVVCSRHCAAIMAARERNAPVPEVTALEKICVDSMTQHFKQVAGLMSPEQGERYLAVVLPRVAAYDHSAAPSVRAAP